MRASTIALPALLALLVPACASSTPREKWPEAEIEEEDPDDVEQTNVSAERREEREDEEDESKAPPKEPEFKENGSVSDAINAVPPGIPRLNVEQDVLGEPLRDQKTWAPCKLGPADHFRVNVAVWNGRAVGIDVEAKNPRVADCVRQVVKGIVWRDKVRSLNTVEYAQ